MVEETSAATHKLSTEANGLVDLVTRFRVEDAGGPAPVRENIYRPVVSPARRMVGNIARAFSLAAGAAAKEYRDEF